MTIGNEASCPVTFIVRLDELVKRTGQLSDNLTSTQRRCNELLFQRRELTWEVQALFDAIDRNDVLGFRVSLAILRELTGG